jgi:hypothetical protein
MVNRGESDPQYQVRDTKTIPARNLEGGAKYLGSHEFCHADDALFLVQSSRPAPGRSQAKVRLEG